MTGTASSELIRDTLFGHICRLCTGGRLFPYPENIDSSVWRDYVAHEKTANLALYGQLERPDKQVEPDEKEERKQEQTRLPKPQLQHEDEENEQTPPQQQDQPKNDDGPEDDGLNVPGTQSGFSSRTHVDQAAPLATLNSVTGTKIDPEKGRDLHLVHWQGDNDTANPQNWSTTKKCLVTGQICLMTTGIYIGSAIFTPGEQGVMEQFGVSQEVATLGLCLFVAGYGIGPMLFSPMSEVPQIGRNPVYLSTLLVFVVFQLGVIFAKNIGMLLAFRFLTGFFGSPVLATGGASIADIWSPAKRAYAIGLWGVAAICGPVLGPLVGGFATAAKGWTWTIWELMWLSGFVLILTFFFLPETSSSNILYRRARRLRKLTGNLRIKSESEIASEQMTGKDIAMMVLVRPFTLNFYEPIVFLLNLYIALVYALLYVWFESFQIVFVGIYGFSVSTVGLSFLGILVGAFIIIPPFFWYVKKWVEPKMDKDGNIQPEERIPPAFIGAFCIPICLFWFGWTSRESVHWIVPIIGSAWFTLGSFPLFMAVLNYLPDAYPEYAASVLAGNDLMRSAFGAGFPLFARQMYEKLGVGGASSLLAGLSIVFIPIPFLLYKYGRQIRMNSPRARHDI